MSQDEPSQVVEPKIDPPELPVEPAAAVAKPPTPKSTNKLKAWWQGYLAHKKLTIPMTVLLVLIVVLAIPYSRYKLLGLFIKRQFSVVVVDAQTTKPISSATISLAGNTAKTSNNGTASLGAKVGSQSLSVTKKYYKTISQKVLVSLSTHPQPLKLSLQATGRQVPISVINKITGKAVENVTLSASGSEVKTDKDGNATIVLPVGKTTLAATISADGYNNLATNVTVTDQKVTANDFQIVPSGKVYFLSKATGKIDVVKTNLDGSDRQTVLAGTGYEDDNGTVMLASRDWKYLALLSVRSQGGKAQLNLIDTSNDKLTNIDQGDASFSLVGWDNDYFTYIVFRNNVSNWQSNAASIKSFNATNGKLITLDNTNATGSSNADAHYEIYLATDTHILGSQVVFTKTWYSYPGYINVAGQQNTLVSVNADGTNKKVVGSLDAATSYFGSVIQYKPQELLVQISPVSGNNISFYTLSSSGSYVAAPDESQTDELANYPTYLLSPSGKQTFWSEARDGKNTLFVGDPSGANPQTIADLSDYTPYAWYTDNYLLVSKNSSELYILGTEALGSRQPLKISDYHKPAVNYRGYGGGYGGL